MGLKGKNMNFLGRNAGVSCVPKAPRETGMREDKQGSTRNHSFVHGNRAWQQSLGKSAVKGEPTGCFPITGLILFLIPYLSLPSTGSD